MLVFPSEVGVAWVARQPLLLMGRITQTLGWESSGLLDAESKVELTFWTENMQMLNRALMRLGGLVHNLDNKDLFS